MLHVAMVQTTNRGSHGIMAINNPRPQASLRLGQHHAMSTAIYYIIILVLS